MIGTTSPEMVPGYGYIITRFEGDCSWKRATVVRSELPNEMLSFLGNGHMCSIQNMKTWVVVDDRVQ